MLTNSLHKYLKGAFLLVLLVDSLISTSQDSIIHQIYSGTINLEEDVRKIELEFEKSDLSLIRWSIENSGRHRLPLINTSFDQSSQSFSGDITFFGSSVFGSISGTLDDDNIKGIMVWHGDTIPITLDRIERQLSYKEEEVNFMNGDINLRGTLVLPTGIVGTYPAVIFAHGSGSATRWWGMYWAAELSQIGIATLLYDKRGCGESEGDWKLSSLDDLALDIVSGVTFLEQHPTINKKRIGIYGVSQGGWIASRVCALTNTIAFVISNSGGGVKPSEEEIFSYDINMKFAGIDEKGRQEAINLVKEYFQFLKTGVDLKELEKHIAESKNQSWFSTLGWGEASISNNERENWSWVATYNPKEDIRKMKMPVLLMFGDQDHNNPTDISVMKWTEALDEASNENYQVNVFKGAGHGLTIGGHHTKGFPKYAEGHIDILKDWLIHNVINESN